MGNDQFDEMQKLIPNLNLHANIRVLRAFKEFNNLLQAKASKVELKSAYVKLVLTMRSDLGKSNISIKPELEEIIWQFPKTTEVALR